MFQNVDIEHHAEEDDQSEDDEILHSLGIGFLIVVAAIARKDERLIRVTERLREHHHYHGDLETGSVDAELLIRENLVIKEERKEDLVCCLIEYAGNTKNQDRERITQDMLQHWEIGLGTETGDHIRDQHQQRAECREDIGHEHITHTIIGTEEPVDELRMAVVDSRTDNEEKDIQENIQKNVKDLDTRKSPRFPFITKLGERDTAEGINGTDTSHHGDIFGMMGITQAGTDIWQQRIDDEDEQ